MGDPKIINPFVPGDGPDNPTISGWAKSVILGGKPTPSATMREVPSIIAGAGPAYREAVLDSARGGAAPAPEAHSDVPMNAGGGRNQDSNVSANDAVVGKAALINYWLDDGAAPPKGPDAFFRKQGGDYSGIGGEDGKAEFEKTFAERPMRIEEAHKATQQAIGERSDALGKFYDEQSQRDASMAAATQQHRAEDQVETQARQQRLDKATQFYSDDLANQGKFWTNPGNIVSAIAYSLLPIFSNDPAIGAKLINQAVEQDMANRQHAAGQTLGALQSNLAGYHKIAGDRQAGDLLAMSEAHRMAANEVQRIAQKFESPISKNNAEAAFQSQMMQSDTLKMEFYNRYVNQAVKKMDPAEFAARGQGYDGAYKAYGPQATASGAAVPKGAKIGPGVAGDIGGTASVANQHANNSGFSGNVAPATTVAINASNDPIGATNRALIEGRIPGGADAAIAAKFAMRKMALAKAGGDPAKARKEMAGIIGQAQEELNKDTRMQGIAGPTATVGDLQQKIGQIQKSEAAANRDPDKFLVSAREYMPSSWVQKYEDMLKTRGSDPKNRAQMLAQMHDESTAELRQEMAHLINSYTLKYSGSAVSSGDADRMSKVISENKSLSLMQNWIQLQSKAIEAEQRSALSTMTGPAQLLYRAGLGQHSAPISTPGVAAPVARPSGQYATAPEETPEADPNTFAGPPR